MDVTVCVGTFGAPEWRDLAYSRAIPSIPEDVPVLHRHADTLAQARNEALALVDTEFVIFCDADDELEPGYIEAMSRGMADLRAPLVRYDGAGAAYPRVVGHQHLCIPECLEEGNWIVIGAAIRTDLLRSVGGFGDEPIYEDWAAWLRCYRAGASIERSEAIYRAHAGARNLALSQRVRREWTRRIASASC